MSVGLREKFVASCAAVQRLALGVSVITALAIVGTPWSADAAGQEMLTDQAVYHEATDTYFELVSRRKQYPDSHNGQWAQVNRFAERRTYKGRRGRLAVVDTQEKHNFLRSTFRPTESVWIGLRYFCESNGLLWVNGKRLDRAKFQNWGAAWNIEGGKVTNTSRVTTCTNPFPYRGVHYWSVEAGFRWNANGSGKSFDHFFVEYPPKDKYWE